MLYDLKPSTSITGGPWYTDQEFDEVFVNTLNQQCYLYLEQKREKAKAQDLGPLIEKNASFAPSADVLKYIMGFTTQKLEVTDVEMILDSLVHDGKVERVTTSDGNNMYRAIARLVEGTGLVKSPCGLCPVRKDCSDVGNITPNTCQYLGEWLSY
ncbi:DNA-directed RNA polymerase III subunit RPC6-like [Trichogramma pretiosum]|uniref:DNA-directed RNA polymerase III subunit RPC6-like n=1 Tax=Trichogramma pretiosum TaxID=7493 RepID=UPI000C719FA4|nr:DNA-directed RNA polymerase III subunit RPC6-like [Trichogramma pretiosum]